MKKIVLSLIFTLTFVSIAAAAGPKEKLKEIAQGMKLKDGMICQSGTEALAKGVSDNSYDNMSLAMRIGLIYLNGDCIEKDIIKARDMFDLCLKLKDGSDPKVARKEEECKKQISETDNKLGEGTKLKKEVDDLEAEVTPFIKKANDITLTKDELGTMQKLGRKVWSMAGNYKYKDYESRLKALDSKVKEAEAVYNKAKKEEAQIKKAEENEKAEKERMKAEQERASKDKEKAEKRKQHVAELVKKYAGSGPSEDFLAAPFRTYDVIGVTDEVATVVEFFMGLKGEKEWKKADDMWIIKQKWTDEMTDKERKASYGFYDLRKEKGYILFGRMVVDGEEQPSFMMYSFVQGLMK